VDTSVDAHRPRNGQFLLTGSQKFSQMRSVSESLAGRADIAELETLSLAEIRGALPQTELENLERLAVLTSRYHLNTIPSTAIEWLKISAQHSVADTIIEPQVRRL
jgi:predicted AAA+ superfamily ATPase